jgi:insecticidal toxin complex protein TccC
MNPGVDTNTPHLAVIDGRGLPVRQVAYCRREVSELTPQVRVTAQQHDAAGRRVTQRDPRLLAPTARPNLTTVYSLSGAVLLTDSVDAGWRLALTGEAGQTPQRWDERGTHWKSQYDEQLRPTEIHEKAQGTGGQTVERLSYADNAPEFAGRNQCGQLIRHDDPAGTQLFAAFGLTGGMLEQTRHFLRESDSPDWPELVADRDKLLELDVGAMTRSRFNPLGETLEQTDAKGNRQFFSQTVAGQSREVRLQLQTDASPKTLVSAIQYNAFGQTERETAGNGVLTTLEYAAEDGRLSRLHTQALQDLRYEYDPVGNVLSIEDAALPIRYFANQRIEPINRYRYDSLYQLIEANGWEAGAANQGPSSSADPAAVGSYRQTYRYDAGNNLLELTHVGPQSPGHRLVAAQHSNRCLPVRNGVEPGEEDFRNGFDANGNLLNLQPGQALSWDLRNQLQEVRPVERDSAADDSERYVYGADGMRVRKVRSTQTHAQPVIAEVRYLPGLELRTHSGTGEVLQVISVQAGRSSVRVLHWEAKRPAQIANDQQRYSLSDHLGSATLELDQDAKVISQERYYPFGGTAWADGEAVQVSYKTVRYSGKERDATGLYYYGFRYYVAWVQRWINPDPAGEADGLNLYCMVRNNPVTLSDSDGLESAEPLIIHMFYHGEIPESVSSNIINTIKTSPNNKVYLWFDGRARKTFPEVSDKFLNFEIMDTDKLKYVKPKEGGASFSNIEAIFSEVEGADNKGKEKSLSDLSELLATYQYGGLYLDADVVVHEEFSRNELFGESEFRSHISIEDSKANVDYYDVLGFKNAFDSDLEEVLKELSSDYEEGYLGGASEPGQLVRIKEIVRLKLSRSLSEEEIDDALSEDTMPEGSLESIIDALSNISISTTLMEKIQFMPMKGT